MICTYHKEHISFTYTTALDLHIHLSTQVIIRILWTGSWGSHRVKGHPRLNSYYMTHLGFKIQNFDSKAPMLLVANSVTSLINYEFSGNLFVDHNIKGQKGGEALIWRSTKFKCLTEDPESRQQSTHMKKLGIIQGHNINSNTFHLYKMSHFSRHLTYLYCT